MLRLWDIRWVLHTAGGFSYSMGVVNSNDPALTVLSFDNRYVFHGAFMDI